MTAQEIKALRRGDSLTLYRWADGKSNDKEDIIARRAIVIFHRKDGMVVLYFPKGDYEECWWEADLLLAVNDRNAPQSAYLPKTV